MLFDLPKVDFSVGLVVLAHSSGHPGIRPPPNGSFELDLFSFDLFFDVAATPLKPYELTRLRLLLKTGVQGKMS